MQTSPTIILIGPMCAGKSTVGKLLADRLGIKGYELDDLRQDYYDEIGYDKKQASEIANGEEGMMGLIKYWKPFEVYAVERVVSEHQNCVLSFGAGHSVFEDAELFTRVKNALAPFDYIILLLPSPDLDDSVKTLNSRFSNLLEREVGKVDPKLLGLNEHFVKHPSNHQLAKFTIYTQGKSPEDTCNEILEKLKGV